MVAVDPSGTKGQSDDGDEIGIIVGGKGIDALTFLLTGHPCYLLTAGGAELSMHIMAAGRRRRTR